MVTLRLLNARKEKEQIVHYTSDTFVIISILGNGGYNLSLTASVKFGYWVCGESWHAMKDSLTHHPSSKGWAPGVQTFFVQVVCCLLYVLGWREGRGGLLLTSLLSFLLSISWASML